MSNFYLSDVFEDVSEEGDRARAKFGRPCAKTALQRGYGWDGRPAVTHTTAVQRRWAGYGAGLDRG